MGINRVESAPFAQIANAALRDTRLSFRARGILAMVLSNVGEWQATREWIARQSEHEGRQAIQTALNELTALGYRRVHKEQGKGGAWVTVTSWYHLPNGQHAQESTDNARELAQETDRRLARPSGEPTVGQPGRLIEDDLQNTIEEHHPQIPMVTADAATADPRFAEFWTAYPRKVGKAAALKAWRQATKREASSEIVAACRAMAADPNLPTDRRLIPHPTTWLNRDGWDDEPYPPNHDGRGPSGSRMFADTAALLAMPGLEIAQ